jgi:hypothetical protein
MGYLIHAQYKHGFSLPGARFEKPDKAGWPNPAIAAAAIATDRQAAALLTPFSLDIACGTQQDLRELS